VPDVREAVGIGDDQAPQSEHARLHEHPDEPPRQPIQVLFHVAGVGKRVTDEAYEVDNLVGAGEDNRGEQSLLVGEILVDGGLGHRGQGRDVVHAGAVIALAQERVGGRLAYHPAFAADLFTTPCSVTRERSEWNP